MKAIIHFLINLFNKIKALFKSEVIEIFKPTEPMPELKKLHDKPFIAKRSKHDFKKKNGALLYVQNVEIFIKGKVKFIYQPHYKLS